MDDNKYFDDHLNTTQHPLVLMLIVQHVRMLLVHHNTMLSPTQLMGAQ
jgi:hypothetical protein